MGLRLRDIVSASLFVVLQSPSHVWLFVTPWTTAHQASLSFCISQSLLRFIYIGLMTLSNHLFLCHLLLLLPSIFFSIRVFFSEPALFIWWPKYSFVSFSISWSLMHLKNFKDNVCYYECHTCYRTFSLWASWLLNLPPNQNQWRDLLDTQICCPTHPTLPQRENNQRALFLKTYHRWSYLEM